MDQLDNYIFLGGLVIIMTFFIIISIRMRTHWKLLEKAFVDTGKEWPVPSPKKLFEKALSDYPGSQAMILQSTNKQLQMVFLMKTDEPEISKHLRGIRFLLFIFLMFPVVFAAVLIVIYTLIYA